MCGLRLPKYRRLKNYIRSGNLQSNIKKFFLQSGKFTKKKKKRISKGGGTKKEKKEKRGTILKYPF